MLSLLNTSAQSSMDIGFYVMIVSTCTNGPYVGPMSFGRTRNAPGQDPTFRFGLGPGGSPYLLQQGQLLAAPFGCLGNLAK